MEKLPLTKTQLLRCKEREWDDTSKLYDSILIIPGGTKHDSGFMHEVIIGVTHGESEEFEICGYPDVIELVLGDTGGRVNTDCFYPQGVFRFFNIKAKFKVSASLSTMRIKSVQI